MRISRIAALALTSLVLLAGCASPGTGDRDPSASAVPPASVGPELEGELTVYAAASLKAAFDELATRFEAAHPRVHVQPIVYDGSSTLATQIIEGAPVDVFASADENNMQKVVDAGLASAPGLFATNTLTIVVPSGNPGGITGLADFADADRTIVVCAAEVPCGAAAATLLTGAGVTASVDSFEQNVTAVLTKVGAREADAGLVYVTDAATTGDVETVATDGADAVVNRYPISVLDGAGDAEIAAAFVDFVLSADGRAVLSGLGFGMP